MSEEHVDLLHINLQLSQHFNIGSIIPISGKFKES